MQFFDLAKSLEQYPALSSALDLHGILKFIELIKCLKPTIALQEASYHTEPPDSLTASVHEFLKVSLDISDDIAKIAWSALRTYAWDTELNEAERVGLQHKYIGDFMEHGLSRGISTCSWCPVPCKCVTDSAKIRSLSHATSYSCLH